MLRVALRIVIRFLFALLSRLEVQGLENIPEQGAVIMVSNHLSRLDSPLVFCLLKRQNATVLAAREYQKNPFIRWLINATKAIWIDRQETDFRALREALDFLRQGGLLGIAPEGTRSKSGALMPAKTGVAYLADKSAAPILPMSIHGTETATAELKRLRRPCLAVRIGQPFTLPPIARRQRSADLQRNTDEIMYQIAALLPPEYRGVYADHPRLQELLSG